jgi:hypothetical protein
MTTKSYTTTAPARAADTCQAMAASASELGVITTYPDGSFTLEPYALPDAPYRAAGNPNTNQNAGVVLTFPRGRW